MKININFEKEKISSSYKTIYLKDYIIDDINKLSCKYNTSFNNIVVKMLEYCLKNGF